MSTISVYKIGTAKGKLSRDAEVYRDVNIDNGFTYARDLPKDEQNCTYYAVTEDNDLQLFTIGDQVIAKEGTMLFMPVCLVLLSMLSRPCACMHMHTVDINARRSPWPTPPCRFKI